jgi:hypothetical protein
MGSQGWRYANPLRHALAALTLCLMPAAAQAACPPDATDGTVLNKGELLLAWLPVLKQDPGAKSGRIPMARHFALDVQLCDRNGASPASLLKVDATMPEHRHGMNYRPVIMPLGGGRFRVEGMMFHMAGRWQLAFDVQAGKETLRLVHDVQID